MRKFLKEIEQWEREKPKPLLKELLEKAKKAKADLLSAAAKVKASGKKLTEKLEEKVISAVAKAIEGFIEMGLDVSQLTIADKGILKKLQEKDPSISNFKKVKKADIEILDQVAKSYITENEIVSALEGAGTGLGGFTLILLDIPVLLSIHLRLISQIGRCYGYDVRKIEERGFILKILQLGYSLDSDLAKKAALVELTKAMKLISKGATWRQLEKIIFIKGIREYANKLGIKITKKKLAQIIPILSSALGAGINYKLTIDVGKAAYMEYRKRFLLEKKWLIRIFRLFHKFYNIIRNFYYRIWNAFFKIFKKQAIA